MKSYTLEKLMDKLIRFAYQILFWATAGTTALFFLLIILNIVARFILESPILGSLELSRLFFIWASFLGATICYLRKAHINISFLVDRFSKKVGCSLNLVIYALSLLFFLVIGYESVVLVVILWSTTLPITKISQGWLYVPVPISMAFLVLFTLKFIQQELALIRQKC